MTQILNAHLLPEFADPHDLAGHTTVVIDVLRASTTITTALAHGADKVIPCLEVAEAKQLAVARPGALLGGERGGERIAGFQLGNSPADYTPDTVAGKTIVFTTTNGTKAISRCIGSARVLIGALVNRAALCDELQADARVDLLCAGTDGQVSLDDVLTAGAIICELTARGERNVELNDAARCCQLAWLQTVGERPSHDDVAAALAETQGGRNLIRLGMQSDLRLAGNLDRWAMVPMLDRAAWEILGKHPSGQDLRGAD